MSTRSLLALSRLALLAMLVTSCNALDNELTRGHQAIATDPLEPFSFDTSAPAKVPAYSSNDAERVIAPFALPGEEVLEARVVELPESSAILFLGTLGGDGPARVVASTPEGTLVDHDSMVAREDAARAYADTGSCLRDFMPRWAARP